MVSPHANLQTFRSSSSRRFLDFGSMIQGKGREMEKTSNGPFLLTFAQFPIMRSTIFPPLQNPLLSTISQIHLVAELHIIR